MQTLPFLPMPAVRVLLALVLLSTLLVGCREPGPGSVSGQIKQILPDGGIVNLAGAQVILRGARDTYTTVSNQGEASGDQADASNNYKFENVPPGTYTMAVTPPAGSGLQPEENITIEVKGDEQFPQSVLLLREGQAKPRPLTPSELNPGEAGYINERGERVVYRNEGGGFDLTDALLLYLIMRNPPAYGYGVPPVIVNNPSSSSGAPRYRTAERPTTTSTGQKVTERKPSVPGQGATRPSSAPAAGSAPSTSGGSGSTSTSPNGSAGSSTKPSSGSSSVSAPSKNGSSSSGSGSSTSTQPSSGSSSAPSQGVSRPSSRPSAPAPSRSSGSSRGGRR